MVYANSRMSFHLSGSLKEYNCFAPNNLIMYHAALWGYENGYKTFLLGGGVGASEDTLLRYKKTYYKGELFHYYVGKKIICPDRYDYLTKMSKTDESRYFPGYRA